MLHHSAKSYRRSAVGLRLSAGAWLLLFVAVPLAQPEAPPAQTTEAGHIEQLGEEAAHALAQAYEYDRTIPLEARTVEMRERDGTQREKVVFRGVQGSLVPGYLEYAAATPAPRPCVLLLHGWSGSKESWWQDDNYISGGNVRKALLQAGFAVLALDAQCHGDRIAENDYAPVNHYAAEGDPDPRKGYFTQNEIYIQTTRDYRRAIDYLETRPDIDSARIGVLGYSMGGTQTFLLTGTEPRVTVAVSVAAPAETSKWSPIAPQNFTRGIGNRPFLTIVGDNDSMCPVPHAQARAALIAGPSARQLIVAGEHRLPSTWVPEAVEWITSHLSPGIREPGDEN
ncbi:MAG: alpha/beta fold hydrolase [Planctomycetaceae bacterium]|nr:alpha/beta fold hydrolase [Planctomycetaceae bacterium]